jgi:Asp-tRNA(Asn)/Glu-tRNA(Gln) amidotransferase A subunit family amidase
VTGPWAVIPWLAGVPAVSTPTSSDTAPIGAMLVGAAGSDADLLGLAALAG